MLNIGAGEMTIIAVVALLLLGPKRLPELARGIGKFMRELRRQTSEVRGVVEREFYKMDDEVSIKDSPLELKQPEGAVTHGSGEPESLPPVADDTRSQALMPSASSAPAEPAATPAEPPSSEPPSTKT